MIWLSLLKDYLVFTKKDRIALLFVLFVLVLVYLAPIWFNKKQTASALTADTVLIRHLDSLKKTDMLPVAEGRDAFNRPYKSFEREAFRKGRLFLFDPNTLDAQGWATLGLQEKQIRTILNYRNKGGRFYKKEDLKKIWGLPEAFYAFVQGHIRIAGTDKVFLHAAQPFRTAVKTKVQPFDVNAADSAMLEALPGIGSKLAKRILFFRKKLGGFYSAEQVGETYGLPDSTFQKIKPFLNASPSGITKININKATQEDLNLHPYISRNVANAIVAYRNQHGEYKNIDALLQLVVLDATTFRKIRPYLVVE